MTDTMTMARQAFEAARAEREAAHGGPAPSWDDSDQTVRAAWEKRALIASEHILQFFRFDHLPPHLTMVSKPFADLAHAIVLGDNVTESGTVTMGAALPRNPERTVALRKLLEAKDAAVRALVAKPGGA